MYSLVTNKAHLFDSHPKIPAYPLSGRGSDLPVFIDFGYRKYPSFGSQKHVKPIN